MDVADISTSILVTLDIILFVISVVGNTLVLVVMHRTKSKQASRNIYLISITLVDLATAIYAIPLGLFRVRLSWNFDGKPFQIRSLTDSQPILGQ